MGSINAEIELSNPRDGEIRPVKAKRWSIPAPCTFASRSALPCNCS